MFDYIFYGATLALFIIIAYVVNSFYLEVKRIEKEQQALITNIIKSLEVINKNNEVLVETINNIVCCIESLPCHVSDSVASLESNNTNKDSSLAFTHSE